MRYSFRLAELLNHVPDNSKRPGTIKTIVEHTGLDRHQVANLLRNEVKYLPVHALARICDYLIEQGLCRPEELPGALFSVEPEHFWETLSQRGRLDLCLGVRHPPEADNPEGALIVASDSVLLGAVLNGLSNVGRGSKGREPRGVPPKLRQVLVWSPGLHPMDEVRDRAQRVYAEFDDEKGDKALVCLGSVKSNPTVELVLSSVFGTRPFEPEQVERPQDRGCPFFLRYRDKDPDIPSCCAGRLLAKREPVEAPGLYYELPDGTWTHPESPQDAALVFFVYHESQGRLEMVLGGFSGRATRALARTLVIRPEEFWPPQFKSRGIEIGAFIVEFTFSEKANLQDILRTDLTPVTKVTPIAPEVIERRLKA